MDTIDFIKDELKRLYETNPNVHVNVRTTHPKVTLKSAPAKIIGVYKSIFQLEECGAHSIRHTFQYNDLLVGQVTIDELNYRPSINASKKK